MNFVAQTSIHTRQTQRVREHGSCAQENAGSFLLHVHALENRAFWFESWFISYDFLV